MLREAAVFVIGLCAGCDALFGLDRLDDPTADGARSRRIVITQATDEVLADFPVSIVLAADPDLADLAQPDGADIRFETPDGAALPFELVAYEQGSVEAWVRVTLPRSTEIMMRYGGTPSLHDATAAWSDRFEAAWHFVETAGGAKDSTRHDHDLLPATSIEPGAATGVVGGARAFAEPAVGAKEGLCASPSDVIDFQQESFSFAMWLRAGATQAGIYDQAFDAGGVTTGLAGFALELTQSNFQAQVADSGSGYANISLDNGTRSTWIHVAVVVDRTTDVVNTYIDGKVATTEATPQLVTAIYNERRMCMAGFDGYSGDLDEPRVYHGTLSAAWLDAEFDNIRSRNEFVQVGPPQ
jgi:hypothetical protein